VGTNAEALVFRERRPGPVAVDGVGGGEETPMLPEG
jgi:hypothetical protein